MKKVKTKSFQEFQADFDLDPLSVFFETDFQSGRIDMDMTATNPPLYAQINSHNPEMDYFHFDNDANFSECTPFNQLFAYDQPEPSFVSVFACPFYCGGNNKESVCSENWPNNSQISLPSISSSPAYLQNASLLSDANSRNPLCWYSSIEEAVQSKSIQFHIKNPQKIAEQIQRNEEICRVLSPFRKYQEKIKTIQKKTNLQKARRKFSLMSGGSIKQNHNYPDGSTKKETLPKTPKNASISLRRWQNEIWTKYHLQNLARFHSPSDSWEDVNAANKEKWSAPLSRLAYQEVSKNVETERV